MPDLALSHLPTPIGDLLVVTDGAHLVALDYAGYEPRMHRLLTRNVGAVSLTPKAMPKEIVTRLRGYFAGHVDAIDALAVAGIGTAFQRRVWAALRAIPPGETRTYGELAARLGLSGAARAVGHANALNPIAIVVPCHRLIGASGKLTGYAGGLPRKSWLLDHERAHAALSRVASASAVAGARL